MKKIWIPGGTGMLGSHLSRMLMKKNVPYVANDFQTVDITRLEDVSDFVRTEKITHIINCAAYTQVDKAETEEKLAYFVNAIGPHHLAVAARRHGAHLLHLSTDYVFDGKGKKPYDEEHRTAPVNAYGMTKLAGEIKILDELESASIIRTSWLFGFPGKNFVETMIRLMSEKEELKIVADQIGRPTYCEDLAAVCLQMLDSSGIYHFANESETNWHSFALEIEKQAKATGWSFRTKAIQPISTKEYPTPAIRPHYSTLDTKKIEAYLGIRPRKWQDALSDYLNQVWSIQQKQKPVLA